MHYRWAWLREAGMDSGVQVQQILPIHIGTAPDETRVFQSHKLNNNYKQPPHSEKAEKYPNILLLIADARNAPPPRVRCKNAFCEMMI